MGNPTPSRMGGEQHAQPSSPAASSLGRHALPTPSPRPCHGSLLLIPPSSFSFSSSLLLGLLIVEQPGDVGVDGVTWQWLGTLMGSQAG